MCKHRGSREENKYLRIKSTIKLTSRKQRTVRISLHVDSCSMEPLQLRKSEHMMAIEVLLARGTTCPPLLPEMQISQSSNGHRLLVLEFIKPILLQPFSGGTIHFHTCIILFSCNRRTLSTQACNFLQLRKVF